MPVITFNHTLPKKDILKMLSTITKKYSGALAPEIINDIKAVNSTPPKVYYNINLKDEINKDLFNDIISDIKNLFDEKTRNTIIFYYKTGNETNKKYTYTNYNTVRYLEFINETHWRSDDD